MLLALLDSSWQNTGDQGVVLRGWTWAFSMTTAPELWAHLSTPLSKSCLEFISITCTFLLLITVWFYLVNVLRKVVRRQKGRNLGNIYIWVMSNFLLHLFILSTQVTWPDCDFLLYGSVVFLLVWTSDTPQNTVNKISVNRSIESQFLRLQKSNYFKQHFLCVTYHIVHDLWVLEALLFPGQFKST